MKILLKVLAYGFLGLLVLSAALVGASFLFPKWFKPSFKTTELRSPSGAVYRIMTRGPATGLERGLKTLGVEYLAESLGDAAALSRAADELETLVKPELDAGGYDSLVVIACAVVRQRGPMTETRTVTTVFQRAADIKTGWDAFSAPVAGSSRKLEIQRRELDAAYAKLNQAVREKDPRAIWDMETADYKDTLIDGKTLDKQEDMAYMQKQFAQLSSVSSFTVVVAALSVDDARAIATVKTAFSGVANDERRKDETYYSEGWSRDVWRKTSAGWRIASSLDLASKSFFFKR